MARSKVFVQTVKVDHLRFEVNPVNAELKSGDFVVIGNITGIVDQDATATGPLSVHTEGGILCHAEIENGAVGDSVYSGTDGELGRTGSVGKQLVGQIVEVIRPGVVVFQKFENGLNVI